MRRHEGVCYNGLIILFPPRRNQFHSLCSVRTTRQRRNIGRGWNVRHIPAQLYSCTGMYYKHLK